MSWRCEEAGEHDFSYSLPAMKMKIAIVDGYNAIYRSAELRKRLDVSLASAREGLVEHCMRWLAARGDISEFCIVFDGDSAVVSSSGVGSSGVRIIFTRTKEDADDRILAMVREEDGSHIKYLVISSDNYVSRNAKQNGAEVMPVADFFRMTASLQGRRRTSRSKDYDSDGLPPLLEQEITASLKKEWGVE